MPLNCTITRRKLMIQISGEVDHHRAKELMQELERKVELYCPSALTLDLSGVTFMDSSGIAVVIHALRQMAQLGGRLQLQSIAEQPMKVLRAAGIEKIVEIKEAVR